MKKIVVSSLIALFSLTACGTADNSLMLDQSNLAEQTNAMASSTKKLSMEKDSKDSEQKADKSKLGSKAANNVAKTPSDLKINYKANVAKNGIGDPSSIANFALRSMDATKTWDSGARIGYQALQDLSEKDVYVAKLGYTSARAATTWEDAYRILALSLSNIANEVPNTPAEACNLTLKSMAATKTWDSGAKVGYAALEFIGKTDNADVRNFVNLIYNSARAARTWEDAHKTIANGLTEMKNMF